MTHLPDQGAEQTFGADVYEEPHRTSVLAIGSLVLSVLCCIPGFGVLGALLGSVSLITIGGSNGRVKGKGLAIAAIVVGFLASAIWIGFAIGFSALISSTTRSVGFLDAAQRGDIQDARQWLIQDTSDALTDEQILAWAGTLTAEWGTRVDTLPSGIDILTNSRGSPEAQAIAEELQDLGYMSIDSMLVISPNFLPLEFDSGTTTVVFLTSTREMSASGAPAVVNAVFQDQNSASVWLLDPAGTLTPAPSSPPASPDQDAPTDGDEPSQSGVEPPASEDQGP